MIGLKKAVVLTVISLLICTGSSAERETSWSKYTGRMFDVEYPSSFFPRAGTPASAYFKSPDGLIEFYVYSAYFTAELDEYKIKRSEEICISYEVRNGDRETTTTVTLKAKNGSYIRFYTDILSKATGRRVFGCKFQNQKDFINHRAEYLHFTRSLNQYAD